MSVLQRKTQELLALYDRQRRKKDDAAYNLTSAAEHDYKTSRGRFKVLKRVDGKFVAVDPSKPNGQTGCGVFDTVDEAVERVDGLSKEADARGEYNAPEKHGYKLNFDDPKNWELVPMKRQP